MVVVALAARSKHDGPNAEQGGFVLHVNVYPLVASPPKVHVNLSPGCNEALEGVVIPVVFFGFVGFLTVRTLALRSTTFIFLHAVFCALWVPVTLRGYGERGERM